jgi:hypothetical protein
MSESCLTSGFVSRIMDIAFNFVTERPVSRQEDQDKYMKPVEFTEESIDITDSDDRLVTACIKLLTSILVLFDSAGTLTTKECVDYIILYSCCEQYPMASAEALRSMKEILKCIASRVYDILFCEIRKSNKVKNILELAFSGNEDAWYCICDFFSSGKIKKIMIEQDSISMIHSILDQSKDVVAKVHEIKELSEEEAVNNEVLLKKAEQMELLALSALCSATSHEKNQEIVESIIDSGILEIVMSSLLDSPLHAKKEACCIFANLASYTTKIEELLGAFPELPLQLLQSLQSLPTHEQYTVLTSIKGMVEFAIKSGQIDPLDCIGGEEGQDIIDELLDTVDVNLFDVVAGIKGDIVASMDDE